MSFSVEAAVAIVGGVLAGILTFSTGYIRLIRKVSSLETCVNDIKKTLDEIKTNATEAGKKASQNAEDTAELKVKVALYWDGVQKLMIDALHHDYTPERDALNEKLRNKSITVPELKRLKDILTRDYYDPTMKDDRLALGFMMISVDMALRDCSENHVNTYRECFERVYPGIVLQKLFDY